MIKEVMKLNGFIIVIFIILYFVFRYLKANDSEDNSGRYSRQSYDAGYPRNRVVPPRAPVRKDFKDREGIAKEYEERLEGKYEKKYEKEYAEEYAKKYEEGESIETDFSQATAPVQAPHADFPQAPEPEVQAPQVDFSQAPVLQVPYPEIPSMEAPVPEAFGLKMPDPMSINTTEIVVDSEVKLDAEMFLDKLIK